MDPHRAELKQLWREKEAAFRSGDRVAYKKAKYRLEKGVKTAKRKFSEQLNSHITANDPSSAWNSLQLLTGYKSLLQPARAFQIQNLTDASSVQPSPQPLQGRTGLSTVKLLLSEEHVTSGTVKLLSCIGDAQEQTRRCCCCFLCRLR
ncbi:hypothetical protein MHYP_G00301550 [Metynnis hypsauchen]